MATEELINNLRSEVDSSVNTGLVGVRQEVERIRSDLDESFKRLMELFSVQSFVDGTLALTIGESLRAAYELGIEEAAAQSSEAKELGDLAILKAAIDEIDDQRTQAEILRALVNRAIEFAPRVGFFVVKNEQAMGWRARGFEGTIGDKAITEVRFLLSAETLLSQAVSSRATWSGSPGANAGDHALLEKLGSEIPQRMVAIPLVVRQKAVAVLYADSAGLEPDSINLEALEVLVRITAMSVELLAVSRPAPVTRPPRVEHEAPKEAAAPERVEHVRTEAVETAPESKASQASATAQAVAGTAGVSEPSSQPPAFIPREPVQAGPLGSARAYGFSTDADLPVEVNEDERRLHNDARRFARLLVSEIKLYNEQKVKEGRISGNIYEVLRDDIDRSREMYEKRVAQPVAARYDYFHHELVSTLADGDPSKLGHSYPGAHT